MASERLHWYTTFSEQTLEPRANVHVHLRYADGVQYMSKNLPFFSNYSTQTKLNDVSTGFSTVRGTAAIRIEGSKYMVDLWRYDAWPISGCQSMLARIMYTKISSTSKLLMYLFMWLMYTAIQITVTAEALYTPSSSFRNIKIGAPFSCACLEPRNQKLFDAISN